eukprot:GILJ01006657.1.p1 GENE.GILJ01006657.1~~GILJ01006657.1.p1  ORF type:complete len:549 (+),score=94.03 GILJ01006657.1:41-1687(+)
MSSMSETSSANPAAEMENTDKPVDNMDTSATTSSATPQVVKTGQVVCCGASSWGLVGRKDPPKQWDGVPERNLWAVHRVKALSDVPIKHIFSGPVAAHSVAIALDGTAYVWGRNETGQLGLGDTRNRYNPTPLPLPSGTRVKKAACGRGHTLLVTEGGQLYSFGANGRGQLGLGHQKEMVLKPSLIKLDNVVDASCGAEFSMAVDGAGHVFAFGLPEYGQLGNGTEGKFLAKANKMEFNCEASPLLVQELSNRGVVITSVACGANHTIALSATKEVYSWGFGGYGRLGLKHANDTKVPTLIDSFKHVRIPVKYITTGATSSFAVLENGSLYMWGITKKSGEAILYPKMVQDVSGWVVRSISCGNTSTAVASETSSITWGPSPTFGELGYGDNQPKSSTTARKVDALEGLLTLEVASGYAHTLFLVDNSSEAARAKLDALPELAPAEVKTTGRAKDDQEDGEEETTTTPKGKRKNDGPASKSAKKAKTTPARGKKNESEEEDDDDDDEVDEEEKAPAKKGRKGAVAPKGKSKGKGKAPAAKSGGRGKKK